MTRETVPWCQPGGLPRLCIYCILTHKRGNYPSPYAYPLSRDLDLFCGRGLGFTHQNRTLDPLAWQVLHSHPEDCTKVPMPDFAAAFFTWGLAVAKITNTKTVSIRNVLLLGVDMHITQLCRGDTQGSVYMPDVFPLLDRHDTRDLAHNIMEPFCGPKWEKLYRKTLGRCLGWHTVLE